MLFYCSLVFNNTSSKRGVDVYSSLYRHIICSAFSVFCNIMMCILDNAGHVIIGFTMPTSEARLALFTLIMNKKVLI